MATNAPAKPRSCHVCAAETNSQTKDIRGSHICGGCEKRFCNKHYEEHRANINEQFEQLVGEHDVLLGQLNSIDSADSAIPTAIEEINRWEWDTIEKVRLVAATARENIIRVMQQDRSIVQNQFRSFTDELRKKKSTHENDETDIEEIQSKLNNLQREINSLSAVKVEVNYQRVDWNAMVSVNTIDDDSSSPMQAARVGLELYFVGTTILSIRQQMILNEFYGRSDQRWNLLYKASRDGFTPRDFHRCCDQKGPTMTIYQESESDYLFGGFATVDWRSSHSTDRIVQDSRAFLFTLTNPHSLDPTKFPIRDSKARAVFHDEDFGPSFGMIDSYSDIYYNAEGECHVHFPRSYQDTTMFQFGRIVFTGIDNFELSEIEVFGQA